jgi:hypothetical protein
LSRYSLRSFKPLVSPSRTCDPPRRRRRLSFRRRSAARPR